MMKNIRYIVLGISLITVLNGTAQIVDYFSTVNYGISVPLGDTKDFISNTSFRGFSFEFGRFFTEEISVGFMIAWSVFNESFPRDTYELEDLTMTGNLYRYINAFPRWLWVAIISVQIQNSDLTWDLHPGLML